MATSSKAPMIDDIWRRDIDGLKVRVIGVAQGHDGPPLWDAEVVGDSS